MRGAAGVLAALVVFLCFLSAGACRRGTEPPRLEAPLVLGGRTVSVEALEHGRVVYTGYCRPCHGDQGDDLRTEIALPRRCAR